MHNFKNKRELAGIFKVSLPVVNKYLKTKKGITRGGLIDAVKLYEMINKESLSKLSKKGK